MEDASAEIVDLRGLSYNDYIQGPTCWKDFIMKKILPVIL